MFILAIVTDEFGTEYAMTYSVDEPHMTSTRAQQLLMARVCEEYDVKNIIRSRAQYVDNDLAHVTWVNS